ncbi:hypothetical protein DC366_00685 [Pelagivirga sediminicola]|uniref:Uncharacterized protein n=1 Tax=Pelagivirga sediminicola TaxID=2170575 RepID=A0A2T7GAS1_9RHOB|nr:hypothetical protein DC366_00685 [Pelagivirga sediminicola]
MAVVGDLGSTWGPLIGTGSMMIVVERSREMGRRPKAGERSSLCGAVFSGNRNAHHECWPDPDRDETRRLNADARTLPFQLILGRE